MHNNWISRYLQSNVSTRPRYSEAPASVDDLRQNFKYNLLDFIIREYDIQASSTSSHSIAAGSCFYTNKEALDPDTLKDRETKTTPV